MSHQDTVTRLLLAGIIAVATPAGADSLYAAPAAASQSVAPSNTASEGNLLSVSFDSSDDRTEISVDEFMGMDSDYRIERMHPPASRDAGPSGDPARDSGDQSELLDPGTM
jgi:hypothetical protein